MFGETLQINGEGDIIDGDMSSFVWVSAIFDSEEGTRRKERSTSYLPTIRLPFNSLALGDVVTSFRNTLHDNATAGVFTIGMFLAFYFLLIFLQLLRGGCQGWAGLLGLACWASHGAFSSRFSSSLSSGMCGRQTVESF